VNLKHYDTGYLGRLIYLMCYLIGDSVESSDMDRLFLFNF